MDISLKDLAERFPEFSIKNYDEDAFFVGFSHDSRTIKENELFIPIAVSYTHLDVYKRQHRIQLCFSISKALKLSNTH